MEDVMVDIETLGTCDGAAIIQIGACSFDPRTNKTERGYVRNVKWEARGFGKIDASTLRWWLKQDAAVRTQVFSQADACQMSAVLNEFSGWLRSFRWNEIWSKGGDFDLRLLRQSYESFSMEVPFKYYKARDMRTVVKTFGEEVDEVEAKSLHNALADAQNQAQHLMNIIRRVKNL